MLISLYVALAAVVFLISCNEFLEGTRKVQIDAFLSLVWIGLIVVAFWGFSWKTGAVVLLLSFALPVLFKPGAARFAAWLMSGATRAAGGRRYRGLPPAWLARISRELARVIPPEKMLQDLTTGDSTRQQAMRALVQGCASVPGISEVLRTHGLEIDALETIYSELSLNSAGQWAGGHFVAASALAYPHTLEYWLSTTRDYGSRLGAAYHLLEHFRTGRPLPSLTANREQGQASQPIT